MSGPLQLHYNIKVMTSVPLTNDEIMSYPRSKDPIHIRTFLNAPIEEENQTETILK